MINNFKRDGEYQFFKEVMNKMKDSFYRKKWWYISIIVLGLLGVGFQYVYENFAYEEGERVVGEGVRVLEEVKFSNKNNQVLDDSALKVAIAVQKSMRNIAQSVSPSVVNIRTQKIVKRRKQSFNKYNDRLPDYFDFFNNEDFFGKRNRGPQKFESLGSGFVIHEKGYIVTNNHVIQEADKIMILFSDDQEYRAKVVGRDKRTDIAVIKIDGKIGGKMDGKMDGRKRFPVTPLGNSDEVEVGDWAIAIGNPFGLKGSFTFGVVSARGRDDVDQNAGLKNYIQTDASINQGNSGGPLLNIKGQAIGMNSAIYSVSGGYIGIGFAIPMNIVKRVVRSLIDKGVVERGYLGVTIQSISNQIAKHLNISKKGGVLVNSVESKGPADRAGIRTGDIIVQVGMDEINSSSQLQRIISSYKKGQKVKIKILRNGRNMFFDVVLSEMNTQVASRKADVEKESKAGFFGLVVGSIEENYRYFRLNKNMKGVVVVDVQSGSRAQESGIRVGDVIQFINYEEVRSMDWFEDFVRQNKNMRKSFFIKINRGGVNRFVVIEGK